MVKSKVELFSGQDVVPFKENALRSTWIVANHVQNVRSSPSFGGSYAESVTVPWDDAVHAAQSQLLGVFRQSSDVPDLCRKAPRRCDYMQQCAMYGLHRGLHRVLCVLFQSDGFCHDAWKANNEIMVLFKYVISYWEFISSLLYCIKRFLLASCVKLCASLCHYSQGNIARNIAYKTGDREWGEGVKSRNSGTMCLDRPALLCT